MKYTQAMVFKKITNLTPYFEAQGHPMPTPDDYHATQAYQREAMRMAKTRPVELLLLVRYESDFTDHVYCRIRCPINPMPVKGEFEAPSVSAVVKFLQAQGWHLDHKIPMHLLND